jgi:hypothetical protein
MSIHKRLTIEELRAFTGFENYTDEMAKETIASLESLSILFYELHQKALLEMENQQAMGANIEGIRLLESTR